MGKVARQWLILGVDVHYHQGYCMAMKKKRKARNAQPEAVIQRDVIKVCRNSPSPTLRNVFAPGNGFNLQTVGLRVNATRLGLLPGIPDLCMPTKKRCVWVEIKNGHRRLDPNQKEVFAHLRKLGHKCYVAVSAFEAIKILTAYANHYDAGDFK